MISVLRGKDSFASMINDLKKNRPLWEQYAKSGQSDLLRMELHTLNGNLRCFELAELVERVSAVEDLHDIQSNDLAKLFAAIENWVDSNAQLTGISWASDERDEQFALSRRELVEVFANQYAQKMQKGEFSQWAISQLTSRKFAGVKHPSKNSRRILRVNWENVFVFQLKENPFEFLRLSFNRSLILCHIFFEILLTMV